MLFISAFLLLLLSPIFISSANTLLLPHIQHLNVTHTIASLTSEFHYLRPGHQNFKKLELIHRDKLPAATPLNNHAQYHQNHNRIFEDRIKRDVYRVHKLIQKLSSRSETVYDTDNSSSRYGVEEFGSDVVSGMEQGSGEYFVRIGVGSPPRNQYMVVDSGSDIVWVQCQPCTQCYTQSDPLFDPSGSASFTGVSCDSTVCSRVDNSDCHSGRCQYEVSYGDGSYTKGTLALETLTFGDEASAVVVRNVAIGCGHRNRGLFVGAAGLLGLGAGPLSFVGQLNGGATGVFTYCLVSRGIDSSGSLDFGQEALPVGAIWVPLLHNPRAPSFYYVGLSGVGVGGGEVPIPEYIFQISDSGGGGVVLDTGTAVTRLPASVYVPFRDAFVEQTTHLPKTSAKSIFDTCYDLSGFMTVQVPTVSFYFAGGPILTLPARNFLIPVDEIGTFCFAFAPSQSGLSIIGNIQQEGIQISFDGANGLLGFGPNVC
uniref:Peptidase A1 domain-containing protein n=1 Tax=Kalanchoe fedtschenkoi TaxID=63787 RepID=A0A7N0VJV2_KALFE